ncbi:MAG TPA: DUF4199 domain-containing protein [Phenylobacterium sp.]|jgi:hypothetical protein|uniref:DUF4199 domain-containing protein n=1 Tax=Phenylobacterium sp. TaxID=1871053 RepID=UPI002BCA8B7C|nr:DUF4199 domain-containing protein [Phenylobacterium sp.]HXA40200.1 DUF4199 domain-containing protein [Phenylobacterium sp.]
MTRIILTYGLISGLVIILGVIGTLIATNGGHHGAANLWLGYLIMLVALSSILVGVRQHRDQALGGTIKFRTALLIGLGIALVASIAYVLIWEVYLAATHYSFMDKYAASMLSAKRAAGVTGAAYAKAVADAETMRRQYANPLYRLPETFLEIFPVGLLIALASAALLRNPRFLPAKTRAATA